MKAMKLLSVLEEIKSNKKQYWIYAVIIKLCEHAVRIRPRYNSNEYDEFRLHPNDIIKITDKDVPEEYAVRLLNGEIISVPKQKEKKL